MQCPQCAAELPDDVWNCTVCAMNVYWANRHYADLARARREQGLSPGVDTASFLLRAYAHAMHERALQQGRADDRVRQIARRSMGRVPDEGVAASDHGPEDGTAVEAAWNTDP